MNDVCFEMFNLSIVPSSCTDAENKLKESIFELSEIARKAEKEISDFISYEKNVVLSIQSSISKVISLISTVDQKVNNAQSQKRQELSPPAKPSVPSNATQSDRQSIAAEYQKQVKQTEEENARIREQNQRIDNYVTKCSAAKTELESILSQLYQTEASVKSEAESTTAQAQSLVSAIRDSVSRNTSVNVAMSEFCFVFDRLYEIAQKLYMQKPTKLREYSYVDRLFEIKNTHNHSLSSSTFMASSVGNESIDSQNIPKNYSSAQEEILIKDRDIVSFLKRSEGISRFKMPSANLHRLGGKAFLAQMSDKGFVTVAQPDGSTIDMSGMIHWEKKND